MTPHSVYRDTLKQLLTQQNLWMNSGLGPQMKFMKPLRSTCFQRVGISDWMTHYERGRLCWSRKVWTVLGKNFMNEKGTRQSTYFRQAEQFAFCIPLAGPDLDPDLNQNRIALFSSPTQLIHQVLSELIDNFLKYHAIYRFWPPLSMLNHHLWK